MLDLFDSEAQQLRSRGHGINSQIEERKLSATSRTSVVTDSRDMYDFAKSKRERLVSLPALVPRYSRFFPLVVRSDLFTLREG